ncbi:DUF4124 domain-containing protein [Coralloluteibacterium thermophilus]|uniref:DUF4124 domain-containing protein n=1 Tax=Coralloluteibacterium thermophilum TaxID=2707049 RepID=A0ABV9NEM5_9GAMM
MPAVRLVSIALAGLLPLAASAQQDRIYTWTDADGVTHYSGSPPPAGRYEERTFTRSGASGSVQRDDDASAAADPMAENCNRARENLELLGRDVSVMVDTNGDGTPDSPLSDTDRANQLELANAQVRAYCAADGAP